jgi:hypothetical protein
MCASDSALGSVRSERRTQLRGDLQQALSRARALQIREQAARRRWAGSVQGVGRAISALDTGAADAEGPDGGPRAVSLRARGDLSVSQLERGQQREPGGRGEEVFPRRAKLGQLLGQPGLSELVQRGAELGQFQRLQHTQIPRRHTRRHAEKGRRTRCSRRTRAKAVATWQRGKQAVVVRFQFVGARAARFSSHLVRACSRPLHNGLVRAGRARAGAGGACFRPSFAGPLHARPERSSHTPQPGSRGIRGRRGRGVGGERRAPQQRRQRGAAGKSAERG